MYKYFLLIFLIASCTPSKSLIQTSNETDLASANKMLDGNRITIKTNDNQRITNTDVYLTKDSVFYKKKDLYNGIALSEVEHLFVSKKPSFSKTIGFLLVGLGIYSFATFDSSGSIGEGLGKTYLGIAGLGVGGITLIVGDSIENKILKFEE